MTQHLKAEERIAQIIQAAYVCFVEKGYAETKITDIAQRANLSKGGIYFHFDSKFQIFKSVVEFAYHEALKELEQSTMASERLADKFRRLADKFRRLAELFIENFTSMEHSRFVVTICEMALREDEIALLILDLQHHYIETLSKLIKKAQDRGRLKPVDPIAAALIFKAFIDGIQLNFSLGVDINHDALIETALTIFLEGMLIDDTFDE